MYIGTCPGREEQTWMNPRLLLEYVKNQQAIASRNPKLPLVLFGPWRKAIAFGIFISHSY